MGKGRGGRKVRGGGNGVGIDVPVEDMNLSPEEMEHYRRMTGRSVKASVGSDEAKVPQKVHEDKVAELNGRIDDLQSKLDDVKKDRSTIRDERDQYRRRFENKQDELETANTVIDQLKAENSKLRGENVRLQSDLDGARRQMAESGDPATEERLSRTVEELGTKLREAQDEVAELTSRLEESESRMEELSGQLERSSSEPALAEPVRESVGKVVRISPDTLESDLFTEPRYTVWLSRDGHTMRITPDVEGRALCADQRMTLPRLRLLLPYDGRSEHDAYPDDGPGITMSLR